MVCVQVIGLDTAVAMAGTQGNFELNVFKPVMIFDLLTEIRLISDSCRSFTEFALDGLRADGASELDGDWLAHVLSQAHVVDLRDIA